MGITPDNILVHEPRPRNERLAEAFKRIGRSKRPEREWTRSTWVNYRTDAPHRIIPGVILPGSGSPCMNVQSRGNLPNLFLRRRGRVIHSNVDELIVMESLLRDTSITPEQAVSLTQRNTREILALLQALKVRSIIASKVTGDKTEYIFSPAIAQILEYLLRESPLEPTRKTRLFCSLKRTARLPGRK